MLHTVKELGCAWLYFFTCFILTLLPLHKMGLVTQDVFLLGCHLQSPIQVVREKMCCATLDCERWPSVVIAGREWSFLFETPMALVLGDVFWWELLIEVPTEPGVVQLWVSPMTSFASIIKWGHSRWWLFRKIVPPNLIWSRSQTSPSPTESHIWWCRSVVFIFDRGEV